MKNNLRLLFALLTASSLSAAPLAKPTAVHAKPDASAFTIAVLKAGTEPEVVKNPPLPTPAGWTAVELGGAHEVWVKMGDLNKQLEPKPGTALRTAPQNDAPVFATMEKGDSLDLMGERGRWVQFRVRKKVVGYMQTESGPATSSPVAAAPGAPGKSAAAPQPAAPPVATYTGAGRAVTPGDGASGELPRLFQGTFASTRRPLMPRRPYDWQLSDSAGTRYAYLDITKLLLTEKIEKYIDHTVVIYGTAKPVPNSKDIVIEVESLQLK